MAAFALGASGVQIGTRFAVTEESSAHPDYKARVCASPDNGTTMALKKIGMVRALRSPFMEEAIKAETAECKSPEQLKELLGRKREMKGIFEGNWQEGLLEAGQGAGMIKNVLPVKTVFENLLCEMEAGITKLRE
ncbi:MAG TPA: nitronate monooxygenase [Ignavibacteriales bacterium]|nr:nitronate monooxygenase [Ignavibacteriales bacterium]